MLRSPLNEANNSIEIMVPRLANSRVFQMFVVKTENTVKELSKTAQEQLQENIKKTGKDA